MIYTAVCYQVFASHIPKLSLINTLMWGFKVFSIHLSVSSFTTTQTETLINGCADYVFEDSWGAGVIPCTMVILIQNIVTKRPSRHPKIRAVQEDAVTSDEILQ